MKRSLATIMLCGLLAWALPASAGIDNAGTTAANFLTVGQGASVLGMGGATLGFGADLNTAYWNNASLTRLNATQIVFSHASLDQENNQEWAAIGGRWGNDRFWSATGLYQGNGSFDGRDALGNSTGTFSASSMALGLNLAQSFSNVSVGLGALFVNETLGDVSGSGVTFNGGVQLQRGIWGLGAAAQNMFGQMKYDGAPYRFPGNVGMGVSVSDPAHNLRLALDMNFPSAYYSDVRTGVEWRYKDHLALRTGYRKEMGADSGEPLGGPTFGMGAGANGLWFDYGLITGGSGASAQHRIGLTYRPGFNSTVPGIQASDAQKTGAVTATAATVPTENPAKKSTTPADQTLAAEPDLDQAPPRPTSTNAKAAPAPSPDVKPGVQYVAPVAAGITVGTAAAAKPTPAPTTATTTPPAKTSPATTAPATTAPATTAPATTAAKPAATASSTTAPATTSAKSAAPVTKPVVTPGATAATGAAVATTTAAVTTPSGTKNAGTTYTKTPTTTPSKEVAATSTTKEPAATTDAKETVTPAKTEDVGKAELAALTPAAAATDASKPEASSSAPAAAAPVPAAAPPVSETPKPAVVAPVVAAPVKPAPEVTKPAAEAAKPATSGPRPAKVKVQKGESMADIAARWGTSAAAIMMENNLVTDKVKPGMELKLPPKK